MCHFLKAERGFPAEIGAEQEGFGQGCWEAGGGDIHSEALVPGSGQGGLKVAMGCKVGELKG